MKKSFVLVLIAALALLPQIAAARGTFTIHNTSDRSFWVTAHSATTLRPTAEACVQPGHSVTWQIGNVSYFNFEAKSDARCAGYRLFQHYAHPRTVGENQEGTFRIAGTPGNFSVAGPY